MYSQDVVTLFIPEIVLSREFMPVLPVLPVLVHFQFFDLFIYCINAGFVVVVIYLNPLSA